MLNFGGMLNIVEYLELKSHQTVYLLDSHRPMNLQNLFGSTQVIVLDDGEFYQMKELKKAFEELEVFIF